MTSQPNRVERRAGQRFLFALPVSLRDPESGLDSLGFTQDVSSRGLFLYTDGSIEEGAELELIFSMPSEITLGETLAVRARGRVLRVVLSSGGGKAQELDTDFAHRKIGIAVRLLTYEYLPDAPDASAAFYRISTLHRHTVAEPPATLAR